MKHFCAEPVTEHDLVVGQLYYFINFIDTKMTKPIIRTRLLEKIEASKCGESIYHFSDPDLAELSKDQGMICMQQDFTIEELKWVYSLEKALDVLNVSYKRLSK